MSGALLSIAMAVRSVHPFPARMAPEIALDWIPEVDRKREQRVLDPMCGSGTVVSVAAERGHHATGVDLDPLAILMTRVATSSIDISRCNDIRDQIIDGARTDRTPAPLWDDNETKRFAAYWFAHEQRQDLTRLSRSIDQIPDGSLRDLAQISLSRTIITKAPKASLAADTSHSRPHRVRNASDYDVIAGFSRAFGDLVLLLQDKELLGSAEIYLDDCRTLACVEDNSVDLVVTSPPYLNAIDYMRAHKFALIWLGYSIPQLRVIRTSSIGAERALECAAHAAADKLVGQLERDADNPSQLPVAILTRYTHDLLLLSRQMMRVLKPGSRLIAVVGNSTLRGNFIRNDTIFERTLHHYGFATVGRDERPLPENRRYLPITSPTSTSSITRRMRTETILHMTAPT